MLGKNPPNDTPSIIGFPTLTFSSMSQNIVTLHSVDEERANALVKAMIDVEWSHQEYHQAEAMYLRKSPIGDLYVNQYLLPPEGASEWQKKQAEYQKEWAEKYRNKVEELRNDQRARINAVYTTFKEKLATACNLFKEVAQAQ